MSTPALIFGRRGGAGIYGVGGVSDAGVAFELVAESDAGAPAGAGGDVLFEALFITVTHTMAATLRFTPILDGVELTAEARSITLPARTRRVSVPIEMALSLPWIEDNVEQYRTGMIGTRLAVRVETVGGLAAGDLMVDEVEIAWKPLTESKVSL